MGLTLGARESAMVDGERRRFAAGGRLLTGVRPAIALSWTRCRDQYDVDPHLDLAPLADDGRGRCLDREVVLTELGGLAGALAPRLEVGVVTVVDAEGRLLGSWGEGRSRAEEAHLAPGYSWSEPASGTNGMGTALQSRGVTVVRGPEHWCEGFQGLDCLGVPIIDPVTRSAVAAVNVSVPSGRLPAEGPARLRSVADHMHAMLTTLARRRAALLVETFDRRGPGLGGPTLVLDAGGRVVAADPAAGRLFGLPADERRVEPEARPALGMAALDEAVGRAMVAAHTTPGWTGSVRLPVPGHGEPVASTLRAVVAAGHPIGFLMTVGTAEGDAVLHDLVVGEPRSTRVVAHRDDRIVLLRPREIRAAEADGNAVWLSTDHGRIRAADRGLTKLEKALGEHGFLRVHRRHLVNLERVVEVARGPGAGLLLFLDGQRGRPVPVSRAQAPRVRERLGL